ncbi:MAG: DUF3488 and transglutaminase-like domain-containing protein [Thermoleophilaceae bacterium]
MFAALGAFAAMHWAALVQSPPVGRVGLAVALTTAAGAGLTGLRRSSRPRGAVHLAALGVVVVGAMGAMVAIGLPARLAWPGHWDDLAGDLGRGLSGIRTVAWPYGGPEEEVRRAILLGAPALLALAAALVFWPVRRGAAPLRFLGLVTLLCLYGIPVTEQDPGSSLARGLVLFALVAAWLWLPRLRLREALPGLILIGVVGLASLPLAARIDRADALVDYSEWNWFGGKEVTFDWNHSYGPLDWPRDGTTLLTVKSKKPLYWKAEVLDTFDGLRWVRSRSDDRTSPLGEMPPDPDTRWDRRIRVTVRSLRTDFVIGAGTPQRVTGAGEAVTGSADGTLRRLDQPLRRGDTYSVRSYAPTPTAGEMRGAPTGYDAQFAEYTSFALPRPDEDALGRNGAKSALASRDRVSVPLRGTDFGAGQARRRLTRSPYARAYALSRRLTAGSPTAYAAVRRVQDHFRGNGFVYSERPPSRRYPLESFLFADQTGYCQQFSGAMALLLRMSGIPTRVVSGFSPGSLNRDTGEYRVRDLDAHSWVEVYFPRIGWVTFDPTPPAAPADRAGQGPDPIRAGAGDAGGALSRRGEAPTSDRTLDTAPGRGSTDRGAGEGGPPAGVWAAMALLAIGGGAALAFRRARGRREGMDATEMGLRELERALPKLGWTLTAGATLLQLERRLGRAAGPASARYVAGLRAGRFSAGQVMAPSSNDRRVMRRELTASGGLVARLRGWIALPPRRPAA